MGQFSMRANTYDVLIAGQARSRDLVLVSRNLQEFRRVEGLNIENWEGE